MAAPRLTDRDPSFTERAATFVDHGIIKPARACTIKVAYPSKGDARHAAKFVGRKMDRDMTVYRCPFGDHWHLAKVRHGEQDEHTSSGEDAA